MLWGIGCNFCRGGKHTAHSAVDGTTTAALYGAAAVPAFCCSIVIARVWCVCLQSSSDSAVLCCAVLVACLAVNAYSIGQLCSLGHSISILCLLCSCHCIFSSAGLNHGPSTGLVKFVSGLSHEGFYGADHFYFCSTMQTLLPCPWHTCVFHFRRMPLHAQHLVSTSGGRHCRCSSLYLTLQQKLQDHELSARPHVNFALALSEHYQNWNACCPN